ATLQTLAADPRVRQGVLTGNLRDVARIKLEVFDLASYLDLGASAYGNDHPDRARLVAIAQNRASDRAGVVFDDAHTVLLGDTPNDVQAAATAGVRVIAVATGKATTDDLTTTGASAVVSDLTDTARVAGLILNPSAAP
ncbi:MAG TPA: HAD hydrolase-like protein, partial [Pseudonocardiaceae bacterium]|nr:HAD hydrolase-like protein [Pseudonocardiaceae bacterium]